MTRPRKPPTFREKLASAILIIADLKGEPIPRHIAQRMTAEQILSLIEWDHAILWANGGTNHPTNLTPRWIREHRKKTAEYDVPTLRKGERINKAHQEFQRKILAKGKGGKASTPPPKAKPKRPGRKLQSRPSFQKREKHHEHSGR